MASRLFVIAALVLAASCAAHRDGALREPAQEDRRLFNLKRAAQLPWADDGRCAVREAAGEWATLVERCYGTLDLSRIQFVDRQETCPIAQAGAMSEAEVAQ